MTTQTVYRLYRSHNGGKTWDAPTHAMLESVALQWYSDEQRWWMSNDPRQRRLKLSKVTVTETEEVVAST